MKDNEKSEMKDEISDFKHIRQKQMIHQILRKKSQILSKMNQMIFLWIKIVSLRKEIMR